MWTLPTGDKYLINAHDYKNNSNSLSSYLTDVNPWHYTLYETTTGNIIAQKEFLGSHTFFTYPKADYFLIPYEYENSFFPDWKTNQLPGKGRVLTFISGTDLSTNQMSALTTKKTPISIADPNPEGYIFPLAPHSDVETSTSNYSFKNQSEPSWNAAGTEFRTYMCDLNVSSWGGKYNTVTLKFQQFDIPDLYKIDADEHYNNICNSSFNSDDFQRIEIRILDKLYSICGCYANNPALQIVNQADQSVQILKNADEIAALGFHTSNVYSLKINPSSKELISASRDGTVRF